MGSFRRFSTIFLEFFYNFLENFWKISTIFGKFLRFFWKIFTIFCDFSENFSENSRPQSVTVRPRSRHYCKFTIKFTIRFILILIKILQSTKFEDSHFYSFLATFSTPFNSLSTFSTINRLSKPSYLLSPLCALSFSLPRFLNRSSAAPKTQTAVPPLTTAEVCGQYEGL